MRSSGASRGLLKRSSDSSFVMSGPSNESIWELQGCCHVGTCACLAVVQLGMRTGVVCAFLRRGRCGRSLSVVALWLRCRLLLSLAKSLWLSQRYGLPTAFDLSRSATRRIRSRTSRTARNEWPLIVSLTPFRLPLPRFLSVRRPPHSMPNNVPAKAPPREGLVRN